MVILGSFYEIRYCQSQRGILFFHGILHSLGGDSVKCSGMIHEIGKNSCCKRKFGFRKVHNVLRFSEFFPLDL